MDVLDDLVDFFLWFRKKCEIQGWDIEKMSRAEIKDHANSYWEMMHGED